MSILMDHKTVGPRNGLAWSASGKPVPIDALVSLWPDIYFNNEFIILLV